MSEQLHLLRPFARWRWRIEGKWVPIDLTERQIDEALPPDLADHIDTMGIG